MRRIAHSVGYFGYAGFASRKEIGGLLHSERTDEEIWRDAILLLEFAVEMHSADAHFGGQFVHTERRIVDMVAEGRIDAGIELLIGTVDCDATVVVVDFGSAYAAKHLLAHSDCLCYNSFQYEHIEWLAEEMVDLKIETVDLCSVAIFAREHDDRNIVGFWIVLDALAELESVAIGHSDIRDNGIGTGGEHCLPCGIATMSKEYVVVVGHLFADEKAERLVVVDDEDGLLLPVFGSIGILLLDCGYLGQLGQL